MTKRQQKRRLDRRRETTAPTTRRRFAPSGPATRIRAGTGLAGTTGSGRHPPPAVPRRAPARSSRRSRRAEFVDRMRTAGRAAREVLLEVAPAVGPGVTTDELDAIAHDACIARGGYPSPLNYRGYPKSLCTSVNEVICHGIPDDRKLREGDIVNCDVTIYLDGVHGDHSETFLVGECDPEAVRLVRVTRECLWHGIAAARPGGRINEIGRAHPGARRGRGLRCRAHVRRARRRARVPHRADDPALLRAPTRTASSNPASRSRSSR